MTSQFEPVFQRIENAHTEFIGNVTEQFGFTTEEAEIILTVYKKAKAVKLVVAMGRYQLTNGAFWEKQAMQNALALHAAQENVKIVRAAKKGNRNDTK